MCKWNWQYPRERWKKLEKYWKTLFREFCFSLITFCTYLIVLKVDLLIALFFPLFLGTLIEVKKKSRLLARYRWWRIRILSLHIEGKVSHTLRSGNQSHWQNIWEKRKILCKVKFHVFGEKSNILFLVIHASTDNIFIVGRKLGIDNNTMEFWDFLKSYVVWQLFSQLVFTILLVIITFYFTCCERNTS